MRMFILAAGLFLSFAANSAELVLNPVKIAPDIYAVIGDLGNQSYENEGLNSNLSFVVTSDGVLVINTGPSMRVARALQITIGKITAQPVKWVVNLNSQNHYWLGNGHFKSLGAAIVAHKEEAETSSCWQDATRARFILKWRKRPFNPCVPFSCAARPDALVRYRTHAVDGPCRAA